MNTKQPECWSLDPQARGLRIELSPAHSLILPHEHFIYAEFTGDGEADLETLRVVFATHEIVLRGHHLRRLETVIQRMELSWITALPERYRALLGDGQPWIREIEVIKSTDETEP
jgi:hypothetical protein